MIKVAATIIISLIFNCSLCFSELDTKALANNIESSHNLSSAGKGKQIATNQNTIIDQKKADRGFLDGFITGVFSIIEYPIAFITSCINMDFSLLRGDFISTG